MSGEASDWLLDEFDKEIAEQQRKRAQFSLPGVQVETEIQQELPLRPQPRPIDDFERQLMTQW